jgi:hypothetical protein
VSGKGRQVVIEPEVVVVDVANVMGPRWLLRQL